MNKRFLICLSATAGLATAWPCAAAQESVAIGFPIVGNSFFFLAAATAMFIILVFRTTLGRLAKNVSKAYGERQVNKILKRHSTKVLSEFIVPGAYGGLTRINHVVLTPGGIICVLTKHYNGMVFCGSRAPQWTNVDGVNRQKFLNPQIQNDGRVAALQNLAPNVPVKNVVVFTGDVEFASEPENNVISLQDLDALVSTYANGPCVIGNSKVIWALLTSAALTDEETRKDFDAQLSFS